MKKSLLNKFYAVVLSLVLLFCSCLVPSFPAYAVDPFTALKIAQYVLTVTGLVKVGDGLVERVTDEQLHSLEDVINACLTDGSIYVSSNGDYVFNSASTKAIYDELTNDASLDAKVVSSFPAFNSTVVNMDYVNSDFIDKLNQGKLLYPVSMVVFSQAFTGSFDNPSSVNTECFIYDVNEVSFFNVESAGILRFKNNNGNDKSVRVTYINQRYRSDGGYGSVSYVENWTNSNAFSIYDGSTRVSVNDIYDLFPTFSDSVVYKCMAISCNRSVVISKQSVIAGTNLSNQTTGIIYNNYYDIIPSVSQTVIEENNWENIYNSYVTNVNNEYQQIYETNGGVTAEELRAILKDIGDRIDEIISDAGGEIIENLDDILTWLSRIYDRLDEIKNASGDNADVIAAIESVNDNLDLIKGDTLYLARLYALLGDILDKMNRGGSGRGFPDIVLDLPDIDNTNIMDYISTGQVIASTLETVLPFAYVPMLEQLLLSLSAEPVTPHWEIPFKIENSLVSIDETIVIDFEQFNTLRLVLNSLIMIGFLIFLIWFTFYLTDIVGNMLF